MGKAKKAKNAKLSRDRLMAKARNAAGAAATAGRARTFADKGDILAKNKGDAEIEEGLEEYEEKLGTLPLDEKTLAKYDPPEEEGRDEETPIEGLLKAAKQALEMIDSNHHWADGFNGKAEGVTGAGLKRAALAFAIKRYQESVK